MLPIGLWKLSALSCLFCSESEQKEKKVRIKHITLQIHNNLNKYLHFCPAVLSTHWFLFFFLLKNYWFEIVVNEAKIYFFSHFLVLKTTTTTKKNSLNESICTLKKCSFLKIERSWSWIYFTHFREKTHLFTLEWIFLSSSWRVYMHIQFDI